MKESTESAKVPVIVPERAGKAPDVLPAYEISTVTHNNNALPLSSVKSAS